MFTIEQKSLSEIKDIIVSLLADPAHQNISSGTVDPSDYQNIVGLENLADPINSQHLYTVGKVNDEIVAISAASKFTDPTTEKVKVLHRLNFVKNDLQGKNIGHALMKYKAEYFDANGWNESDSTTHFAYVPIVFDNADDFFSGTGWEIYTVAEHGNNSFIGYRTSWGQYKTIGTAQVDL